MIILHVMKITVTIMMTIKLLIMVVVVMMIKIELFISDSSSRSAIYFFLSTPCRSEGLSDKAKMPVFKPSFIVDRKTCYEKIY